eukprot:13267458-Alexandrium_andersonii.AAC.1
MHISVTTGYAHCHGRSYGYGCTCSYDCVACCIGICRSAELERAANNSSRGSYGKAAAAAAAADDGDCDGDDGDDDDDDD